jgi:signal transduction histidine kinase
MSPRAAAGAAVAAAVPNRKIAFLTRLPMRLGYRLSFALIAASVLVTSIFGVLAIREEKRDLLNGMKHETWITVATLQPAVEFALVRHDSTQVQEFLDGLGHQRILGAAIYQPDGTPVIRSRSLPALSGPPLPDPRQVLTDLSPAHAMIDLGGERVFAYAVPLLDRRGRPSAVLAVYHLTTYLDEDLSRERLAILVTLVASSILTAGLVFFIVNRAVSRPIDRLIRKVMALRKGDFPGSAAQGPPLDLSEVLAAASTEERAAGVDAAANGRGDELGRLAGEFDRMAEDLARSREALIGEAEKRLSVERGLRRFDRMATLGQLTSNLAHEVGTPLGVLRGRAEFLMNELGDRSEARREAEIIIAQIDRITRTIERFLSASRSSSPIAEPIVADDLLREAAALVDLECRRQGIRLVVDAAAGDAVIHGQRDGLMQVLLNLAVNGIQAMAEGGELRFAARRTELRGRPAVEFEVTDTGPGIPEDIQKQIFEPFFSTRGTTGLGLFISRSIVREHDGTTTVESASGSGATFRACIPLGNEAGAGGPRGDAAAGDVAAGGATTGDMAAGGAGAAPAAVGKMGGN